MAQPYLIDMQAVDVRYPISDGLTKLVLNNIHLRVREGEFVSLLGPSGCGKSTLMRMILASECPTEGTVLVGDKEVTEVNRDRGIVYQKYSLFPHLTVLDNIAFGPQLEEINLAERLLHLPRYFKSRKKHRQSAMEYLAHIGLSKDDALKYPKQLSGGMQQRVAIAQAMIMRPKVLLMDEPFGALDDRSRRQLQHFLIKQWQDHKMTVIFVTHDMEEAVYLGTRVIALSQYWSDDSGRVAEGAVIVKDMDIPSEHPRPEEFKYTPEFNQIVREIREEALTPENRRHIKDCILTHEDAVQPSNA